MPSAEQLAAWDRILERLGWGIWPLLTVAVALFAFWVISKGAKGTGQQVEVLQGIQTSLGEIQSGQVVANVNARVVTEILERLSTRVDSHDDKEEARHRETLRAIERRP